MAARRVSIVEDFFEGEFHLPIIPSQLIEKDNQAAVYLGLRQLEWLFLTSHNSWIVFRLTKILDETILVYSPMIDMKNSSAPFRAYFGALLSIVKNIPAKPTIYPTGLVLDMFPEEEEDEDPADESPYEPSDGESGPSAGGGDSSRSPMIRSRRKAQGDDVNDADNGLMVCSPRTLFAIAN
jgi:hypothetical protein